MPSQCFTALSLVGYDINVEQRILICFYCVFLGFCLKLRLLLLIIRPKPFDCIVCCEKKIFYTRDDSRVALHGYQLPLLLSSKLLISNTVLLELVVVFFFFLTVHIFGTGWKQGGYTLHFFFCFVFFK